MKKYFVSLFLMALMIVPFAGQGATLAELTAQLAALQAKIATFNNQPVLTTVNSCWFKTNQDISYGDGEGDGLTDHVSTLQRHLIAKGYLNIAQPTGFYGQLTRGAVKAWQNANNLAVTGVIRSADRAVLCGGNNIVPPFPCASGEVFNSLTGAPCVIDSNDININSISGPNSLNVGQTGTWTVRATGPSGTNLTYSVDWGDSGYSPTTGAKMVASPTVNQTSTFTHSYSTAGTYTVKFKVFGSNSGCPSCPPGANCATCINPINLAQTSLTVVVGKDTSSLTVYSTKIIGSQSTYSPGQMIKFSVTGRLSDGSVATPTKGFHVQSWMQKTNPPETVLIGKDYQSFNAEYNYSTGYWDVTMTAPSDSSQTYKIEASLYCSNSLLGCSQGQINKSFNFTVENTSQSFITVLSPNGGESYQIGEIINARWISQNIPSYDQLAVYLYSPTLGHVYTFATKLGTDTSYQFPLLSNLAPGSYKINVCDNSLSPAGLPGKSLCDISDNYFTIIAPTYPVGCTSTSGYSLTTGQDCSCASASGFSSNNGAPCDE